MIGIRIWSLKNSHNQIGCIENCKRQKQVEDVLKHTEIVTRRLKDFSEDLFTNVSHKQVYSKAKFKYPLRAPLFQVYLRNTQQSVVCAGYVINRLAIGRLGILH
jgi:hypothetical protein